MATASVIESEGGFPTHVVAKPPFHKRQTFRMVFFTGDAVPCATPQSFLPVASEALPPPSEMIASSSFPSAEVARLLLAFRLLSDRTRRRLLREHSSLNRLVDRLRSGHQDARRGDVLLRMTVRRNVLRGLASHRAMSIHGNRSSPSRDTFSCSVPHGCASLRCASHRYASDDPQCEDHHPQEKLKREG